MSIALYKTGGLRFWTEREILHRQQAIDTLQQAISYELTLLNPAWQFHRVEGPLITPREHVNSAYDGSDIWELSADVAGNPACMRPETTASSYLYAQHMLQSGLAKAPLCIWQTGKSFRRETNDGASPSKLRFNEFYQAEWQCIYKEDTKADIKGRILPVVGFAIEKISGSAEYRVIPSDRLPSYSKETLDIEVPHRGKWKEMASVSKRTDFPIEGKLVLEIAVGLDRLISVEN
jgi:glycyl-tRNA synthetase